MLDIDVEVGHGDNSPLAVVGLDFASELDLRFEMERRIHDGDNLSREGGGLMSIIIDDIYHDQVFVIWTCKHTYS